jgi:hypothetical protein
LGGKEIGVVIMQDTLLKYIELFSGLFIVAIAFLLRALFIKSRQHGKEEEIKSRKNNLLLITFAGGSYIVVGISFLIGKILLLANTISVPSNAGVGIISTTSILAWPLLVIIPIIMGLGLILRNKLAASFLFIFAIIMIPGMLYNSFHGSNLLHVLLLIQVILILIESWKSGYF